MFPSPAGDAMDKIVKDQEEFEKEHQFMQVHITASPDFLLAYYLERFATAIQ